MHKSNRVLIFPAFPFLCLLDQLNVGLDRGATVIYGEGGRGSLRGRFNYLLNVVLLESLSCTIDGVLLHLLAHVSILNHGLSITHCVALFGLSETRRAKDELACTCCEMASIKNLFGKGRDNKMLIATFFTANGNFFFGNVC